MVKLTDVRNTAAKLHKNTLTSVEYNKYGRYHASTLTKRFGAWKHVLKKSGLEAKENHVKFAFTNDDVIKDVMRVADIYPSNRLTAKAYDQYGTYRSHTLLAHYGSWSAVLKLAGLDSPFNRHVSDEELFAEIERIWKLVGRQPKTTDLKKGIAVFSLQRYTRRFSSWHGALQAFVQYMNRDASCSEHLHAEMCPQNISPAQSLQQTEMVTPNGRDFSLQLRFSVTPQEHFTCCTRCSASEQLSGVEVRIDMPPRTHTDPTTHADLQAVPELLALEKQK